MSDTAYLLRAPAGIAGVVSRTLDSTIEPVSITPVGTTGAPALFGIACSIDATTGNLRVVADPDASVYGFLAKPYPAIGGGTNAQQGLGTAIPPGVGNVDCMVRGYMSVHIGGTQAAVKGGLVYVWSSASTGTHVQGQVEAADPATDGFVVPQSYFMGAADANGITEIGFNI